MYSHRCTAPAPAIPVLAGRGGDDEAGVFGAISGAPLRVVGGVWSFLSLLELCDEGAFDVSVDGAGAGRAAMAYLESTRGSSSHGMRSATRRGLSLGTFLGKKNAFSNHNGTSRHTTIFCDPSALLC